MRILVTGGLGFIGTNLIRRLLQERYQVVCLDSLLTGQYQYLAHLESLGAVEWIRHDVTEPLNMDLNVDAIYHLACAASPKFYQQDGVLTTKTCVLGALNMLDLATRLNVPILQASTSEVYGDPAENPQHEEYWGHVNPIGIRSCYDEGKRMAESLFFDYHRAHGTKIKIARIFNTYGPFMRADDGRVISNFIVQALTGENITIYGTGAQTRSFCFIDDLVQGLMTLMATSDHIVGPINLGNPRSCTIGELAEIIQVMTKATSQIIYHSLPQDDPRQRQPDITRAKEILGWSPKISLEDGLQRTIAYFAQLLELPAIA